MFIGTRIGIPQLGNPIETGLGDPPAPYKSSWKTWYDARRNAYIAAARDATVGATLYFSYSTGDDGTGNGTQGNPYKTLDALNTAANALVALNWASGIELKLKCGDTFPGGISIDSGSLGAWKISSYGVGNKPIISKWTSTGYLDADNAWTNDSGNLWYKTSNPAREIGWIRLVSDPYNPFKYCTSSANVALTPYSFYQERSSATFTADASTEKLTSTAHGLNNGDIVYFSTTGTIPGSLSVQTSYYVVNKAVNDFQISNTSGGSAINITSAGSGTHTWYKAGKLWLNPGAGNDPNTVDYEVVADRNRSANPADVDGGISIREKASGTVYIDNIVVDGHGADTGTDVARTSYGIGLEIHTSAVAVLNNVESYYNGRHNIARTTANSGGVFVVVGAKTGFGTIDNTQYVDYQSSGLGEGIFHNCISRFGKAPSEAYADTFRAVTQGGPSSSLITAHTAGGGAKIGLFIVYGMDLQDNRGTQSRATYELGGMSANDVPGTAYDLSTYRCFVNFAPVTRLNENDPFTVTADATANTIQKTAHGLSNGDLVALTSTTSVPGGTTSRRWYYALNKTANDFQLAQSGADVASVNAGTDTISLAFNAGFANTNRVMIRKIFGRLPGGLDETTLYYVVGASGSDIQLSLTSGGAAVDITDAGVGKFVVFGAIVDITTAGSGTITCSSINVGGSSYIRSPQSSLVVFQNVAVLGLVYSPAGGSATSGVYFQYVQDSVNLGTSTNSMLSPGNELYHCHFKFRGRQNANNVMNGSNANAKLFNSIVEAHKESTASCTLNVTNATASMRGNAFYDPSPVSTALATQASNDDYKVTLSSGQTLGAVPGSTFDTEGYPSPNGYPVQYDFYFNPRNTATPSIGPIRA